MEENKENRSFFRSVTNFFSGLTATYRRERRKFPRRNKVYISEAEIGNDKKFITITNLSKGGIGICIDENLKRGTSVKVTFSHEFSTGKYKGKKVDIAIDTKVRWSHLVNSNDSGVEEKKNLMSVLRWTL